MRAKVGGLSEWVRCVGGNRLVTVFAQGGWGMFEREWMRTDVRIIALRAGDVNRSNLKNVEQARRGRGARGEYCTASAPLLQSKDGITAV